MSKNNHKASIGLVENWKKNLISYYTEGKRRRKKKEERKRKKTEHRFSTRFNQFPSFNHLPSTSRLLEMTRWNWSEGNFFERWPENNRLSFPGFQSNASQRYTHCILKVFEWSEINFRDRETNFPRAASTMVYFHGRMAEARTTRILYEGWGSEREREREVQRARRHTKPFAIEMMRYIRGLRFIRDASWKRRFKIHISKLLLSGPRGGGEEERMEICWIAPLMVHQVFHGITWIT